MKKTYITPEALTVQLSTTHMMAESLPVGTNGTIESPDDILTKETRDINLWDNEW